MPATSPLLRPGELLEPKESDELSELEELVDELLVTVVPVSVAVAALSVDPAASQTAPRHT